MGLYTISEGERLICKGVILGRALEHLRAELENLSELENGDEIDLHIWREA